jgi:hypothetical protein
MPVRWRVGLAIVIAIWASSFAMASVAQIRNVSGQVGILGEWELTATVTRHVDGGGGRWAGPLSLKHVGFCSADGPEEKVGELRLLISDPPKEVIATLVLDGSECIFRGYFKDSYDGVMTCPGRGDVPMMLTIQ